ncbi:CAAX amino protease [Clostridia bacterium]|nr:CAAX amino protease [Clostridia bacterium]
MLLNEIIRAIIQLAIFVAIPLIWWLITTRKKENFFVYIGIKKPTVERKAKFWTPFFLAIIIAVSMSLVLDPLLPNDIQLANARFVGQGTKAGLPIIVFAFFATGLPEEILFRGFISKRISKRLGFIVGNTIQAILFGLLHGATMFPSLGFWIPMLVIVFTGTLGWLMGYMNEKADGSIIPSIILHGLSNVYACLIVAFELL